MTFLDIGFSKLHRYVERNISYQSDKFYRPRLSGSNFTRGRGTYTPQTYMLSKSSVLIGLMATAVESELVFTDTKVHRIARISKATEIF